MHNSRLLIVVAVAALGVGCGSSTSRDADSVSSYTIPPSTLLSPADGVTVPFTADDGALLVTAGPPPGDIGPDEAVATLNRLRTYNGTPPKVLAIRKGLVTLEPGLAPTPTVDEPAWVVVYTQEYVASCPAEDAFGDPDTTVPASASNLTAIIVTSDSVLGYLGAGTGICTPRTQPEVLSVAQLEMGQV